jgi:hypothetical protein
VGEEDGKHTEDDWVSGEDSEVWVQFLYSIRGVFEADIMEGTYV